ncbi:8-oxo-dGTP pyrophosphatase MutT (NUDIX family) [Arthrobacter silviterrae]|uniref:NUDIX domain-containing protein n=1 Tax=Arthrobacter silviterrae TaxID=2026658 RepID=A0ABX0D7L7_9MICC|nr:MULTISPECIES: NUDIX domain-containing protein [Arthrobacter]MCU6479373.1 NUDIX domain-containing protein [Arthrobacter sp. A2-55]MDQ0277276.1 8-oxo-dGTP pyrophosphatase MutT (NUDIX family) [Arthrobacter silviterrae]NGN82887.1 NUDIX domain-containing protein [Arthrobacter silviterrae]
MNCKEAACRNPLVPVAYVIFRRDDSVLLQLRQGTGYMDGHWATAAAGHVEPRESAIEAAVREAHEELGVVIDPKELVPLTTMHRGQPTDPDKAGRVDFFFICESWAGNPHIMEASKAAGLQWYSLNGLPKTVVPHERYVLDRLTAGLPPMVSFGFSNP